MSEWQPIETAPKDGTTVLVSHDLDPSSKVTDGIFGATTGVLKGGLWHLIAYFLCTDMKLRKYPTHWQPLPSPPPASLP